MKWDVFVKHFGITPEDIEKAKTYGVTFLKSGMLMRYDRESEEFEIYRYIERTKVEEVK